MNYDIKSHIRTVISWLPFMAQKSFNTGNVPVDNNIQIHYISAPNRQIGPRFIKIGPNPDPFLVPILTKSGHIKSDFYQTF